MPEIKLTDTYPTLKMKGHSNTMSRTAAKILYETVPVVELYALLFQNLEKKLRFLEQQSVGDKNELKSLVQIATTSFVLPTVNAHEHNVEGDRRAIVLIAAAAGAAGLFPEKPSQRGCKLSTLDFQFVY